MLDSARLALLAAPNEDPNTQALADWLRDLVGPIFLVIVGIAAIFFLFTHEIMRFVQFVALAIAVGVIFYAPGVITVVAKGIITALGVESDTPNGG